MLRFLGGFVCASVLWGGAFAWYVQRAPAPPAEVPRATEAAPSEPAPAAKKKARKKRPGAQKDDGTGSLGDDIGWDEAQNVDMAGGEQQLTGSQIDAGFDAAMAGIRRCLVLVPADREITGKVLFGMRVGSNGVPKAVNLTGPSAVTAGESGSCLKRAAESIRFAPFQGPDMVFKYPITLQ